MFTDRGKVVVLYFSELHDERPIWGNISTSSLFLRRHFYPYQCYLSQAYPHHKHHRL